MLSRTDLIRVAALTVTLGAAPLAFGDWNRGLIQVNDAMCEPSTGTCCREHQSICNAGGQDHTDYYYKSEGPCS